MAYVLLQQELLTPTVEQLKRAFSVWPALTEIDAQTAAHDAFGIVLKGLEQEQAVLLQEALRRESVETAVVKESDLPVIPAAKVVKQIEFMPAQLSMYDPMKRHFAVPWTDILLMAAGNVRLYDARRTKTSLEEPHFTGSSIPYEPGSGGKSKEHYHLILELVLVDGTTRYNITADEFDFDCLGAKVQPDLETNFISLIREVNEFVPYASLNRGAYLICEESGELFRYPSKAAFWEEMTWMLWRINQARQAEAGESSEAPQA